MAVHNIANQHTDKFDLYKGASTSSRSLKMKLLVSNITVFPDIASKVKKTGVSFNPNC